MNQNKEKMGLIAVILGNSIFGFSFLFSKIALGITIPAVLIAVRFTVAFLVLNLIVFSFSHKINFSLKGKPKKDILLLAIFQPVIYFITENYGIYYTSSSFGGIIISLIPIVGIVLDYVIFKEKITVKQSICAALSVVGVVLTTVGAQNMNSSVKGTVLLLIAAFAGAIFYVFSKRSGEYYNAMERTYVMFGLGSVFYIVLAAIQCYGRYDELIVVPMKSSMFWMSVAYLAVVSSVAAFLLLNYGSSRVSVSRATILANLTTVISIFAGVIFMHERFSVMQIVGVVIILGSVYVATVKNDKVSKEK